jgi:hypothetical protein
MVHKNLLGNRMRNDFSEMLQNFKSNLYKYTKFYLPLHEIGREWKDSLPIGQEAGDERASKTLQ